MYHKNTLNILILNKLDIFRYVEAATRRIAKVAKSSKIVIEKSTVPCKTAESMRVILEANSSIESGIRFDILSNPEFLAEGFVFCVSVNYYLEIDTASYFLGLQFRISCIQIVYLSEVSRRLRD